MRGPVNEVDCICWLQLGAAAHARLATSQGADPSGSAPPAEVGELRWQYNTDVRPPKLPQLLHAAVP